MTGNLSHMATIQPREPASNCDLMCVVESLRESACEQNCLANSPHRQGGIYDSPSRTVLQTILRETANGIKSAVHRGSPIIKQRGVINCSIGGGARPSFYALFMWMWVPIQERRPSSQFSAASFRKSIAQLGEGDCGLRTE